MSEAVIISAVRDFLRSELSLSEVECEATPAGKPLPACGQRFVGIYVSNPAPREQIENAFNEDFSVTVVVTVRSGFSPEDRQGTDLLWDASGLSAICNTIKTGIHNNRYVLLGQMNDLLALEYPGETVHGFIEPLEWVSSSDAPEPVDPDWFSAESADDSPAGYRMYVTFGNLYRIQSSLSPLIARP